MYDVIYITMYSKLFESFVKTIQIQIPNVV